jgi:hypothetical protein
MNAMMLFVEQHPALWCLGMQVTHEVYRVLRWDEPHDWMFSDSRTEGHARVFARDLQVGLWVLVMSRCILCMTVWWSLGVLWELWECMRLCGSRGLLCLARRR